MPQMDSVSIPTTIALIVTVYLVYAFFLQATEAASFLFLIKSRCRQVMIIRRLTNILGHEIKMVYKGVLRF